MQINRSAAPGPVFPTRVYADVGKAIAWLCKTFGFNVCFHYGPPCNPSGAQLVIGEGPFFSPERVTCNRRIGTTALRFTAAARC
jgi:hypothetical protein